MIYIAVGLLLHFFNYKILHHQIFCQPHSTLSIAPHWCALFCVCYQSLKWHKMPPPWTNFQLLSCMLETVECSYKTCFSEQRICLAIQPITRWTCTGRTGRFLRISRSWLCWVSSPWLSLFYNVGETCCKFILYKGTNE